MHDFKHYYIFFISESVLVGSLACFSVTACVAHFIRTKLKNPKKNCLREWWMKARKLWACSCFKKTVAFYFLPVFNNHMNKRQMCDCVCGSFHTDQAQKTPCVLSQKKFVSKNGGWMQGNRGPVFHVSKRLLPSTFYQFSTIQWIKYKWPVLIWLHLWLISCEPSSMNTNKKILAVAFQRASILGTRLIFTKKSNIGRWIFYKCLTS